MSAQNVCEVRRDLVDKVQLLEAHSPAQYITVIKHAAYWALHV